MRVKRLVGTSLVGIFIGVAGASAIPTTAFALTQSYDPSIGAITLTLAANESVSVSCTNTNGTGHVRINGADLTAGPNNCYDVLSISVTGSTGNETINLAGVTVATFQALINTTITGGAGNDTITGSAFEDLINPGIGVDSVNAGLGSDTFIWQVGDGSDSVMNGGGTSASDGSDIVVVDGTSAADDITIWNSGGQYSWTGINTATSSFEGVSLNGGPYSAVPNLAAADGDDRLTIAAAVVGNISVFGNGGADVINAPYGVGAQPDLSCGLNWQEGDRAWYTATSSAAPVHINDGVVTQEGVLGDAYVSQCSVTFNGLTTPITGGQFRPLSPTRIYDTRPNSGYIGAGGAMGANEMRVMPVASTYGLPDVAFMGAVVLNVTVDDPKADGFLKLYAYGDATPATSSLNFVKDEVRANNATVALNSQGTVAIFASAPTHVIVDVLGYFTSSNVALSPTRNFTSVDPFRLVDTRGGTENVGRYVPGGAATLPDGGEIAVNIASDITGALANLAPTAVTLNVTALNAVRSSFVTVYPSGTSRPNASNLNLRIGAVVPNLVTVPVGTDGYIRLYSLQSTDLVVDLLGFFGGGSEVTTDGRFVAVAAQRLFDSRSGSGYQGEGAPVSSDQRDMWCGNLAGLPSGYVVGAVVMNATAIPFAATFVTLYPSDAASRPLASNLNALEPGRAVSNAAWVATSNESATLGGVRLYYSQVGDLVVDVVGYFTAS